MGALEDALQKADIGRRISEAIALHLEVARMQGHITDVVNRWCAFKFEDGTSDGENYRTKDEAMRFQKPREREYFYIQITPDGISSKDALRLRAAFAHPYIDHCAPAGITEPQIFPRHSNLTPAQRRELERQYLGR